MACASRLPRPSTRDIHVWRIELRDNAGRDAESLSPEERRRWERLHDQHRARFAISHAAMRAVLGSYLGLAPAEVPLEARYGQPPRVAGLQLSLAHCEQLALFAIGLTPIGVDLEAISHVDVDDLCQLAKASLAPAELNRLFATPPHDRPRVWLRSWVRKEAVLKAQGQGLADRALSELDVTNDRVDGRTLVDLDVGPGYLAAAAITPPAEQIILREWIDSAR